MATKAELLVRIQELEQEVLSLRAPATKSLPWDEVPMSFRERASAARKAAMQSGKAVLV